MDEDDEDDAADNKEPAPTGTNALWSQFQVCFFFSQLATSSLGQWPPIGMQ
jgi:hypothetical protein